ncbi:hypothetical protein [Rhodoferax sp.]|nr:hypothetical protein [Rhodoferax sp.]
MTEYAVVTMLTALVLIWSGLGNPSPIQKLISAIKSFYGAFSFAISVSS